MAFSLDPIYSGAALGFAYRMFYPGSTKRAIRPIGAAIQGSLFLAVYEKVNTCFGEWLDQSDYWCEHRTYRHLFSATVGFTAGCLTQLCLNRIKAPFVNKSSLNAAYAASVQLGRTVLTASCIMGGLQTFSRMTVISSFMHSLTL